MMKFTSLALVACMDVEETTMYRLLELNVATAETFNVTVPKDDAQSLKVTVPVGVPPTDVTVAVKVTDCPYTIELVDVASAVVVPTAVTLKEELVAPVKPVADAVMVFPLPACETLTVSNAALPFASVLWLVVPLKVPPPFKLIETFLPLSARLFPN